MSPKIRSFLEHVTLFKLILTVRHPHLGRIAKLEYDGGSAQKHILEDVM
jgi:hypothetical protein